LNIFLNKKLGVSSDAGGLYPKEPKNNCISFDLVFIAFPSINA